MRPGEESLKSAVFFSDKKKGKKERKKEKEYEETSVFIEHQGKMTSGNEQQKTNT